MSRFSIRAAADAAPDRIAALVAGEPWTYARLAEAMSTRSIDGDGPVVCVPQPGLDGMLDVLAAFDAGRPLVPLHPRWSDDERRAFADAVLGGPPLAADTLAILATSGSSGRPKGVELSRGAFVASADASARRIGWAPDGDRWLLTLPLAHVGGLSILVRCWLARRTVVVPPPHQRFDPVVVARWLDAWGVTLVSWVPTQLRRMLDRPDWRPPTSLRLVLLGGAAASPTLLDEARERGLDVRPTYGMTEACSQVATLGSASDDGVGRPLDGVEVRIAGAGESDESGPIEVRGPVMMTGYRPTGGGSGLDADGWFRTGDLGRLDANGCLHVLGRADAVIVTGGENVHPAPVEAAIEALDGVSKACVVGLADVEWGQIVAAAVEPMAGAVLDAEVVRQRLRGRLAAFRIPRRIAIVDRLPTTPSGKIDRQGVAVRLAVAAGGA